MKKGETARNNVFAIGFSVLYLVLFLLLFTALYRMLSDAKTAQGRAGDIAFLQMRIYLDSALQETKDRVEETMQDEEFHLLLSQVSAGDAASYRSLTAFLEEIEDGPLCGAVCLFNLTDWEAVDAQQRFYLDFPRSEAVEELFLLSDGAVSEVLQSEQEGFFFLGGEMPRLLYFSTVDTVGEKKFAVAAGISMDDLMVQCSQSFSPETCFFAFLPEQESYFSSAGLALPEQWRELEEENGLYLNGSRVTVRRSSLTGFSYLLSSPQMGSPFLSFWICVVCFVLLSGALFVYLFRVVGKKVHAVMPSASSDASVQDMLPVSPEPGNSLPEEKKEHLEETMYTQTWYLKKVILGEVRFSRTIEYEKYNLHFAQARLFLLFVRQGTKGDDGAVLSDLTALARDCFSGEYTVYLFRMGGETAGVVFSHERNEKFEEQSFDGIARFSDMLHHRTTPHTIYVSAVHEVFSELPEAYEECLYTKEYCYLHSDTDSLVSYSAIKEQSCSFLAVPRTADIRERFLSCMAKNEFYAARNELVSLIQALREIRGLDNRMAKTSIYDIVDMFLHGISMLDQEIVESLFDKYEMISRTMQIDTFSDLQTQIESVMNALILRCDTKSMPMQEKADAVAAYLQIHYKNPDLSLELLANQFSISVQHLSTEFKNKTGTGVQDYLCRIRVERAKRLLLQNPALSVAQVGEEVGFLSSQTFIRSFKRMESVTPGQYRRQAEQDCKP